MVLVGGYGKFGAPLNLLECLEKSSVKDLTVVCGIAACAEKGSSIQGLLQKNKIKKLISANVGDNPVIIDLFKKGQLEVLLEPMGTLVEKARSGGFGIPGFYSRVGMGTYIEEGGVPTKMSPNGKTVVAVNLAKQKREFKGKEYLFDRSIQGDYALVKAWKADTKGNCVLKMANRNTNVDFATAGKICIVEADEIVQPGELDGDDIHIAGIFVHKVVKSAPIKCDEKCCVVQDKLGKGEEKANNEFMLRRAAKEIKNGDFVALGPGLPSCLDRFTSDIDVHFVYPETGVFGAVHGDNLCHSELYDGCLQPIKLRHNAALAKASDAFAGVRGGHMNLVIAEGFQVSKDGDLANLEAGDKVLPSPGVNMDLACSGAPVVVVMPMTSKAGPTLVNACKFKLTGKKCVSKVITEAGVFDFRGGKLTLAEIAPGLTVENVRSKTKCKFQIADDLKFTKIE